MCRLLRANFARLLKNKLFWILICAELLLGVLFPILHYMDKGIGSRVIGEVLSYLKSENYEKIRLGVDKGNPQSYSFWNKNGFVTVEENQYIIMERIIM